MGRRSEPRRQGACREFLAVQPRTSRPRALGAVHGVQTCWPRGSRAAPRCTSGRMRPRRPRTHACQYARMSVRACMCMYVGCAAPAGATAQQTMQHRPLEHRREGAPARGANSDPRTTRPCCSLPTAPRRTAQQERPGACRAFLAVQRRTIRARQRALVHHAPGSVCTIWGRPPAAPPRVVGGAPMRNKYERICQYALAYVGVVPARRQRASGQRAGAQGSSCTPAPHTLSPGRLVQCAREHGAAHAGLLGALVPCSHGVGGRR